NETSDTIQGMYTDNVYAQSPQIMTGTITPQGRTFTIIFPQLVNGVKTIRFSTPIAQNTPGSLPMSVQALDSVSTVLSSASTIALMSPAPVQILTTDNNACSIGFGALT